jgi:hypothetical protein
VTIFLKEDGYSWGIEQKNFLETGAEDITDLFYDASAG